jgi:hypothetical protein
MTQTYDCQLTLALPVELEEEIIDLLRGLPELVSGFSILPAEGFGAGARLASTMEQVRGRSRRRLVQLLLPQPNVEPLLLALRQTIRSPEVAWWTMPVSGFGRFA